MKQVAAFEMEVKPYEPHAQCKVKAPKVQDLGGNKLWTLEM